MANKNNDVFQMLVTSGNRPLAANGVKLVDLLPGQLGVFNSKTDLAVSAATFANSVMDFYLAVGIGADGVTEDVIKTPGAFTKNEVSAVTGQCYVAPESQIWEITDFTVECDTDYCVKFSLSNKKLFSPFGYNSPYKTFVVKSNCCEGCEDCPTGDCNYVAIELVNSINADTDDLFVAELIVAAGGAVILPEAVPAWVLANPNSCLGIRVTVQPEALSSFCCINLNYSYPRATKINIHMGCGFECTGVVTETQEMVFEQGSGYDIAYDEYNAGGWNGRPGYYRINNFWGIPAGRDFSTYVDPLQTYTRIAIHGGSNNLSAWKTYHNLYAGFVAIPTADTITSLALVTILDGLMVSQLAEEITDCIVVAP